MKTLGYLGSKVSTQLLVISSVCYLLNSNKNKTVHRRQWKKNITPTLKLRRLEFLKVCFDMENREIDKFPKQSSNRF